MVLLGVALFVLDVGLPIPSSIVAAMLCWRLGPFVGGVTVSVGVFLAFVAGYGLGRLVPEARLRDWIGPALWDHATMRARDSAMWWIVFARPLPVLSELSAILAGVWRVPLVCAFVHAATASLAVGTLYGISASLSRQAPSIPAMLIAMMVLPAVMWGAYRLYLCLLHKHA
jgi:membrane protein YqaA with SNARE-associated domain